ncbi:MAG: hypothetical protein GWO86_04060, partial [Planctomycetes bacterium]|nr:hypothetical protein [Planctomycetota bacterium]
MKKIIILKFLMFFVFAVLGCALASAGEEAQVAATAKVLSLDEQMKKKISV